MSTIEGITTIMDAEKQLLADLIDFNNKYANYIQCSNSTNSKNLNAQGKSCSDIDRNINSLNNAYTKINDNISGDIRNVLNNLNDTTKITKEDYDKFVNQGKFNFVELYNFLKSLPNERQRLAVPIFIAYVNNPYIGVPVSGPSNPIGCKLVVYKPNNPQYAKQGAVESSTRILKLNVTTIEKNAASYYTNQYGKVVSKNNAAGLVFTNVPFLYKNKPAGCDRPPLNFYPSTFQNKKLCRYVNKPEYFTPVSQASPYRYEEYIKPVASSNHYKQSPNSTTLL